MKRLKFPLPQLALSLALLTLSLIGFQARATDIANTPLIVSSPNAIQANIFYVLDDSGSMSWDFVPDNVGGYWGASDTSSSKQNSCRTNSTLPSSTNSGSYGGNCCQGASTSNNYSACWSYSAPFSNAGHPPFLASTFNGMAYNPAVRYLPPVDASGNTYPSQTSWTAVRIDYFQVQNSFTIDLTKQFPDLAWCTDSTYTDCLRNSNYVLPGTVNGKNYSTAWVTTATGTGLTVSGSPDNPTVSASAVALGPHYYVITPGEYCTTSALRKCQTTQTSAYNVPAYVRWCDSAADASAAAPAIGTCQATRTVAFPYARYPTRFFTAGTAGTPAVSAVPATASFNVSTSGCSNSKKAGFSTFTIGSTDLFGGVSTPLESSSSNLASDIATNITNKKAVNGGYSATSSGSTVTITAPVSSGNFSTTATLTRAATSNSSCSILPTTPTLNFTGYVAAQAAVPATNGSFPGSFTRVDITPGTTSSPNTFPKAATRTDCVALGSTATACTYAEEMTNFANWWTYYHTRMQATKSAIMRAFAGVGSNRRVGYMSIDNNTGADFINLGTFQNSTTAPVSTQRTDWYNKIIKAYPSSGTPLRVTLAKAGRLYGGRLNGTTLNGSTVQDPMLYACQKNFTILSTDGFWNDSSTPTQLDGVTAMGDQDGALARPMYDGTATPNTLADVAAYYYNTDLRTGTDGSAACTSGTSGLDVCGNNQTYSKQNMVTFTLGLGISGYMKFDPNYATQTSGDYFAIKNGSTANPAADVCSWQASGPCNWPVPLADTLTAVDDLWHAAVNGGGSYYSASDPTSLDRGLTKALSTIDQTTGAAAAAATSNPNITSTDNAIYLTSFTSGTWSGEIVARTIDPATGNIVAGAATWTAASQLDANASRTIYMFSATASNKLKPFSWSTMTATEQGYFSQTAISSGTTALSQFCNGGAFCLSSSDQATASGQNLVNFLAGTRTFEGDVTDVTKYYRARSHVLGDIVNAESVFVGHAAGYSYTDAGYAAFKSSTAIQTRQRMLYAASNDGMLHAFNADTGAEVWAYVPTAVLPKLFLLADKQYSSQHRYFVDATPMVQDVYIGGQWRTILVGGLGAGGTAYYALDITDPNNPVGLWEYTDANLGNTFGTPEIGKLTDGTWAVFFGSGYNNVGDGVGRLYVLNAATGALIRTISTGVGSTGTPSGLAQIRAWVNNANIDNTVQRVYGGDTLGNVWRLDVNNNVGAPGYDAQQLASLRTAGGTGGNAQPITTRPELYNVNGVAVVYIGTGRYLGTTDYTNTDVQSIYAIKDDLSATAYLGNPRDASAKFVQQTLTDSTCPSGSAFCTAGTLVRTNTNPQPVDWTVNGGWYVDLPRSAERVNTDPQVVLGTLVVTSNVITNSDACRVGGYSFVNYFDAATGAAVANTNGLVSVFLGDALSTRTTPFSLPNGNVIGGQQLSSGAENFGTIPTYSNALNTRRVSWRDLNSN